MVQLCFTFFYLLWDDRLIGLDTSCWLVSWLFARLQTGFIMLHRYVRYQNCISGPFNYHFGWLCMVRRLSLTAAFPDHGSVQKIWVSPERWVPFMPLPRLCLKQLHPCRCISRFGRPSFKQRNYDKRRPRETTHPFHKFRRLPIAHILFTLSKNGGQIWHLWSIQSCSLWAPGPVGAPWRCRSRFQCQWELCRWPFNLCRSQRRLDARDNIGVIGNREVQVFFGSVSDIYIYGS